MRECNQPLKAGFGPRCDSALTETRMAPPKRRVRLHPALGVMRLLPKCRPPTHTGFSNLWWRYPPCMTPFEDAALWRRETEKPFSTVLTSPPTKCHTTRASLSKNGTHAWTLGSQDGERQLGNEPLGAQCQTISGSRCPQWSTSHQGRAVGCLPSRAPQLDRCTEASHDAGRWRSDCRSGSRRIYERQTIIWAGFRF